MDAHTGNTICNCNMREHVPMERDKTIANQTSRALVFSFERSEGVEYPAAQNHEDLMSGLIQSIMATT